MNQLSLSFHQLSARPIVRYSNRSQALTELVQHFGGFAQRCEPLLTHG
jgi:hypothetical protein